MFNDWEPNFHYRERALIMEYWQQRRYQIDYLIDQYPHLNLTERSQVIYERYAKFLSHLDTRFRALDAANRMMHLPLAEREERIIAAQESVYEVYRAMNAYTASLAQELPQIMQYADAHQLVANIVISLLDGWQRHFVVRFGIDPKFFPKTPPAGFVQPELPSPQQGTGMLGFEKAEKPPFGPSVLDALGAAGLSPSNSGHQPIEPPAGTTIARPAPVTPELKPGTLPPGAPPKVIRGGR